MRSSPRPRLDLLLAIALPLSACSAETPQKPLAEKAEKLAVEKPAEAGVVTFELDSSTASLGFTMDAPIEKIRGKVPGTAVTGTLYADLAELSKSRALIAVDLGDLELFQRRQEEDGSFGEEIKSDTQNQHARQWLEISDDTPADVREKNAKIEFSVAKVEEPSAPSVEKLEGNARKVTFKATGEFLLHQRKAPKSAEIEAVFHYEGDKPTSVDIKTSAPLVIGLDEYDVRPREGFGKLAAKTLEALAPKVAKTAAVTVEFTARVKQTP